MGSTFTFEANIFLFRIIKINILNQEEKKVIQKDM